MPEFNDAIRRALVAPVIASCGRASAVMRRECADTALQLYAACGMSTATDELGRALITGVAAGGRQVVFTTDLVVRKPLFRDRRSAGIILPTREADVLAAQRFVGAADRTSDHTIGIVRTDADGRTRTTTVDAPWRETVEATGTVPFYFDMHGRRGSAAMTVREHTGDGAETLTKVWVPRGSVGEVVADSRPFQRAMGASRRPDLPVVALECYGALEGAEEFFARLRKGGWSGIGYAASGIVIPSPRVTMSSLSVNETIIDGVVQPPFHAFRP